MKTKVICKGYHGIARPHIHRDHSAVSNQLSKQCMMVAVASQTGNLKANDPNSDYECDGNEDPKTKSIE